MPPTEIVFKPKYAWSMLFAMYLYPIWVGLFAYFLYQFIITKSFNPQGFLAVIFGLMTFSLPFRVFREMRFAIRVTVKRYLLPDLILEYKDILEFNALGIKGLKSSVPLLMLTPESYAELEGILQKRLNERNIRLRKK